MIPLADAHVHFFADGYPGRYGPLFRRGQEFRVYQEFRKVHGIKAALAVGYEGSAWASGHNRHIARLARNHAWITPIAYCLPECPPSLRQCAIWKRAGYLGVSLYIPNRSQARALAHWPDEVFQWLNVHRAIVSVNVPMAVIGSLASIWPRCQGAQILISHLGLPALVPNLMGKRGAEKALEPLLRLSQYPQVGVKLSGLYALCPHPHDAVRLPVRLLRSEFGTGRLYWGSDFSPALDSVSFPQTVEAVQDMLYGSREKARVMGGNLLRAISLSHEA